MPSPPGMSLIIGADGTTARPQGLAEAEVSLPPPGTAPEATHVLSPEVLRNLLAHEDELVRQFAVEQVVQRELSELADGLAERLQDAAYVAVPAARGLEELRAHAQVDAILAAFKEARGEFLAACASTLGVLAPTKLLPAIQDRGRIDDEAFAGVLSALAIAGEADGIAYLDRALTRANVQSPERRGALYSAALMSGDPRLVQRTLGQAIAESEREAPPEGGAYPGRAALASVAGAPVGFARVEAGKELWRISDETLRREARALLGDKAAEAVEAALPRRDVSALLSALEPATKLELPMPSEDRRESLGTMPKRRQDFLRSLIGQRMAVSRLSEEASALFAAAATRAVAVLGFAVLSEDESPGVQAMAKASDGQLSVDLLSGPEEPLVEQLKALGERALRPVVAALSREVFRKVSTIRRLSVALLQAGHGKLLLEAAAETDERQVHGAVVQACVEALAAGEAVVVDVLEARDQESGTVRFALLVATELRTERVALTLGRRFYELRAIDPVMTAQAILRTGDGRLVPLLASRSFADEPEETAVAVLALATETEIEGRIQQALNRVQEDAPPTAPLRVPLNCTNCGETLAYSFHHAYVDVEAKEGAGDPAFVGPMVCKACGARDALVPTQETGQILTMHMMQFLNEMQAGQVQQPPLVTPGQTEVLGKKIGIAAALRKANDDVAASPEGIRPRLQRVRLGLLLARDTVEEDLSAVEALDANSVEAKAMRAQLQQVRGDQLGAMETLTEVVRRLLETDEPRLYDAPDADSLRQSLEAFMLELIDEGVAAPQGIDLTAAEARRREAERRQAEQVQQMQQAGLRGPPPKPRS